MHELRSQAIYWLDTSSLILIFYYRLVSLGFYIDVEVRSISNLRFIDICAGRCSHNIN